MIKAIEDVNGESLGEPQGKEKRRKDDEEASAIAPAA
jgi:hypothetical protein